LKHLSAPWTVAQYDKAISVPLRNAISRYLGKQGRLGNPAAMASKDLEREKVACEGWRGGRGPRATLAHSFSQTIVNDAIEALGAFFSRPLPSGARWEFVDCQGEPCSFAKHMLARSNGLTEMCRDLLGHEGLTAEESDALSAVVVTSDAVGLSFPRDRNLVTASEYDEFLETLDIAMSWEKSGMDSENRRSAERDNLVLDTELLCRDLQYRIRLRNISPNGAMIEGAPHLVPGDRAKVRVGTIGWIDGTIAWSLDSRCGLRFNRPIDLAAAGLGN
jgi:hypothetical protein